MSRQLLRRSPGLRTKAAVMAVTIAASIGATALTSPAVASPTPIAVRGSTTVSIGGLAVAKLQADECGSLSATASGGAVAITNLKGAIKVTFKIASLQVQEGSGALRLNHTGGVILENDCYTIGLTGFRVTDFGAATESSAFELSAVVKVGHVGAGREVIGLLDLSGAQLSVTGTTVRVSQIGLLATGAGAELLNQLTTGDPLDGPFAEGDKFGFAKIKVTFL